MPGISSPLTSKQSKTHHNNLQHAHGKLGLGLVLALLLSACQSGGEINAVDIAEFNYRQKHPIMITEAPENMDIPVAGRMRRINRQLRTALISFAQEAKMEGDGFVEILVPEGAANDAAVKAVAPQIRAAITSGGIARRKVVTRTYQINDPAASGPIRVSYARMKASVHKCGQWPENIKANADNTNFHNFGCSQQANLAAMVDNPADLLRPRPSTPSDPARRARVIGAYRQGQNTSSQHTEGVGANVSGK
ncbi:CpaD family pilus assembly protein [Polycladidibacter stylochi]|uniref:CpaD family pilus assembly protein n=1 Tax=Polycladidibacter stylochi TaxID=1807766 RepID=UPI0009E76A70|nr:CpaD family pilus assembly protein [Pseudovibrio stylochi]